MPPGAVSHQLVGARALTVDVSQRSAGGSSPFGDVCEEDCRVSNAVQVVWLVLCPNDLHDLFCHVGTVRACQTFEVVNI